MYRFREHISIVFTAALVFGMLWQTFIVIDFYINRETITEEHCVNIDKPEMNCKGQCHLKKQLEAATPEQSKKTESTSSSKTSLLILVYADTRDQADAVNDLHLKGEFPETLIRTNAYSSDILDPPQWI